MTPIEQLFIRACKTEQPKIRLISVLRRFYIGNYSIYDNYTTDGLIKHLSVIVDAYCPMKTLDVIVKLEEDFTWLNPEKPDYRTIREKALDMLISRIAMSKRSCFNGLTIPKRNR